MRDDAFFVAAEIDAVGGLDRRIKCLMGRKQIGGHLIGVVKIRERFTGCAARASSTACAHASIRERTSGATASSTGTSNVSRVTPGQTKLL